MHTRHETHLILNTPGYQENFCSWMTQTRYRERQHSTGTGVTHGVDLWRDASLSPVPPVCVAVCGGGGSGPSRRRPDTIRLPHPFPFPFDLFSQVVALSSHGWRRSKGS